MKRFIIILLLITFALQSVQSLMTLTVFYWNQDYISKNICVNRFDAIPICNGQCVLKKKLQEDKKEDEQIPVSRQKEIQLFCQEIKPNITFNFSIESDDKFSLNTFEKPNPAFSLLLEIPPDLI